MGFNPQMLILAREAAALTQNALALDVGISQALISKIENGFEVPGDDLLRRMATACGVPVELFSQTDDILGEGLVDFYHKKRATLPAKPLRKATALSNMVRLEVVRLLRTIDFLDVAPWPLFSVGEHGSPDEIAGMVRALWRVSAGPMPNLVAIVEAAAVPVFALDLEHDKLSAISMPGLVGRHVIILNSRLPASAQRFALAHELGHLVMHNGVVTNNLESEADRFASALLMPAEDIRPDLRGIRFRDLGALKPKWRVSLAALIMRAHRLAAISDRQYRTFNIELNKLPDGRKHEPGEFEPEQPRLMRHVLDHYQQELGYSPDEICKVMVVTEERLQESYFGEPLRRLRAIGSVKPSGTVSVSDVV